jgi:2-hydroxychromene-2-carboxylate isomerase
VQERVLSRALPQTYRTHLECAASAETKETLKKVTERAVTAYGAFGAPWIVVDTADGKTHAFFGSDRFDQIEHVLSLDIDAKSKL